MSDKSHLLSTVQRIKLRKLELEIEALWEEVQSKSELEARSLLKTSTNQSTKSRAQINAIG
jgi:hypothetical protein